MGASLGQVRFRWNLIRAISWLLVTTTALLTLTTLSVNLILLGISAIIVSIIATTLAVVRRQEVWIRSTLCVQGFLFALGVISTIWGSAGVGGVPVLMLVFVLILASEQALSGAKRFSAQSLGRMGPVGDFNAAALSASLGHLYEDFGRNALVFGAAFLLSLVVGTAASIGPKVTLLSDPSLYAILASISLALLIALREETSKS